MSFADPAGQQFRASLPLVRGGQLETSIPFVTEGGGFFIFLALMNPSPEEAATVTVEALGPDGARAAAQQVRLGPRTTLFSLVRDLLHALPSPFTGSLRIHAEGPGIIVGSGVGADSLEFLTILPAQ